MSTQRLTAKFVEKITPPDNGRVEHWDLLLPGFGLRVNSSGRKSWCVMYRSYGRKRRQTLGAFPAVSLEQARNLARKTLSDVAEGRDPAEEHKIRRAIDPGSLEELGALFIESHAKPNNKSWKNQSRRLEMHLYPKLGHRPVESIRKRDVVLLLEHIANSAGAFVAEDTLKVIRKMFNWAADRDIIEINPAMYVKPPQKTLSRDRVLSEDELGAVWRAAEGLGYPFGPFIQLLTLTGQRRTEVAEMRRDEIDGDLWTIPANRNKSGREHIVPLSEAALEIMAACHKNEGPYIFSTTQGEKPISGFNKPKAALDEVLRGSVSNWRFHDLRRTCATGLGKLGLPQAGNRIERKTTWLCDRFLPLTIDRRSMIGESDSGPFEFRASRQQTPAHLTKPQSN